MCQSKTLSRSFSQEKQTLISENRRIAQVRDAIDPTKDKNLSSANQIPPASLLGMYPERCRSDCTQLLPQRGSGMD